MNTKKYIIGILTIVTIGFVMMVKINVPLTFSINQNNRVFQDFETSFKPLKLQKKTSHFSYFNQSFKWKECKENLCLVLIENDADKQICTELQFFETFKNQQLHFVELSDSRKNAVFVTKDLSNIYHLYVVRLQDFKTIQHEEGVENALWLNNSTILYNKKHHIYLNNILYNLTSLSRTLPNKGGEGEITFQKNKSDNILIHLKTIDEQYTLIADLKGNILNIPIFKNTKQIQYKLDKTEANWVCTVQNFGDYHQLLTTQGDITDANTKWQTVISSKDKIYFEQIKSFDAGILIKGFKNGHNFIATFPADLSSKKNIKFDETLYEVDLNNQPFINNNLIQITNRENGEVSFNYNLTTKETLPVQNTENRLNAKYFDLVQLEGNSESKTPIITFINRVNVRKNINAVIIKIVGEPKLMVRDHLSDFEVMQLEEGYTMALIHALPRKLGFISTKFLAKQTEIVETTVYNGIQEVFKEFPEYDYFAVSDYHGCNVLLHTIINHPNLFKAVILSNPVFQKNYTAFQKEPIPEITDFEKSFMEAEKWKDPLTQITKQHFPTMLFINNQIPSTYEIAVFNKLTLSNTGTNKLYHYTNFLQADFINPQLLTLHFFNNNLTPIPDDEELE